MTVSYNPSVVTNGLVLAYDAANIKSYDPRENLLTYSEGYTTNWTATRSSVSTNQITAPDGISTASKLIEDTSVSNTHYLYQPVFVVNNTYYTYSVYVKSSTRTIVAIKFYQTNSAFVDSSIYFNLSTGTITSSDAGISNSSITSIGNGWYRISATSLATATVSGNIAVHLGQSGTTVSYTGDGTSGLFIWGSQIEKGTTATNYIKTLATNNPRSILSRDLSGNVNTGTLGNGVTYSSDNKGGFVFDGVNQNITVPYSSIFNFNAEQTIIIWLKPTENDANRRNPYNQAYGGGGTITHETNGTYTYFWGTAGTDTTPYTGFGSTFTVVQNEIAQIAITRNASSVSWYKNGVFSNSTSNPYRTGVVTGTNSILIGSGYVFPHQGSIYSVYVYTKALTANQIKQNFNAFSGRFNL